MILTRAERNIYLKKKMTQKELVHPENNKPFICRVILLDSSMIRGTELFPRGYTTFLIP